MGALVDANDAYKAVTIVVVDWDKYSRAQVTRDLKVPRRSTLVAFKGGKEVGRVVARTDSQSISKLFDAALS